MSVYVPCNNEGGWGDGLQATHLTLSVTWFFYLPLWTSLAGSEGHFDSLTASQWMPHCFFLMLTKIWPMAPVMTCLQVQIFICVKPLCPTTLISNGAQQHPFDVVTTLATSWSMAALLNQTSTPMWLLGLLLGAALGTTASQYLIFKWMFSLVTTLLLQVVHLDAHCISCTIPSSCLMMPRDDLCKKNNAVKWLWVLWTSPQMLLWPRYADAVTCGSWFSNVNLMVTCPLIYFIDWLKK